VRRAASATFEVGYAKETPVLAIELACVFLNCPVVQKTAVLKCCEQPNAAAVTDQSLARSDFPGIIAFWQVSGFSSTGVRPATSASRTQLSQR
jgi:hypothetical protein